MTDDKKHDDKEKKLSDEDRKKLSDEEMKDVAGGAGAVDHNTTRSNRQT
jgi:hypothetical protein